MVRPDAERTFLRLARERGLLGVAQAHALVETLRQRGETGLYAVRDGAIRSGLMSERQAYGVFRDVGQLIRQLPAELMEVGKYLVQQEVGRGSMGVVYRAVYRPTGRTVALKLLPPRLGSDPIFLKRFYQEARAAARLTHPNVVGALDVGYADGVYYFAMEFIDGSNLKEIVDARGPLDEREALKVCYYVAKALAHAHEAGIWHRDIKPANILVSSEGRVKLTDLGLARVAGHQDPALSEEGRSVGTPYYMAPEQAMLKRKVGASADLYGLGCSLFYLLTGRPPYLGRTPSAILAKHISAPIPDPRQQRPELSPLAASFVRWLMGKSPKDRPENAEALIGALQTGLARGRLPTAVTGADPSADARHAAPRRAASPPTEPRRAQARGSRSARRRADVPPATDGRTARRTRGDRASERPGSRRDDRPDDLPEAPPRPARRRRRTSRPDISMVDMEALRGERRAKAKRRSNPDLPRAARRSGRLSGTSGAGRSASSARLVATGRRGRRRRGSRPDLAAAAPGRSGERPRSPSNPRVRALAGGSSGSIRRLGSTSARLRATRGRRSGGAPAALFAAVALGLCALVAIGVLVTRSRRAAPDLGIARAPRTGPPGDAATDAEREAYYRTLEAEKARRAADEAWAERNTRRREREASAGDAGDADAEAARLGAAAERLRRGAQRERETAEETAAAQRTAREEETRRKAYTRAFAALRTGEVEDACRALERAVGAVPPSASAALAADLRALLRLEQAPQSLALALARRIGRPIEVRYSETRRVAGKLASAARQHAVLTLSRGGEVTVDLGRVPLEEILRLGRDSLGRQSPELLAAEGILRGYTGQLDRARRILASAGAQGERAADLALARIEALYQDALLGRLVRKGAAGSLAKAPPAAGKPTSPRPGTGGAAPKAPGGTTTADGTPGSRARDDKPPRPLSERALLELFEVQPESWSPEGAVDFRYPFQDRLKRLGRDFELRGRAPRYDEKAAVLRLEAGPGVFWHRATLEGDLRVEVDLRYDSVPENAGAVRILLERTDEKGTLLESRFGLSLSEIARKRVRRHAGPKNPLLAARSELRPKQTYRVVLILSGGIARVLLDGAVRAHLPDLDPKARWRVGLAYGGADARLLRFAIRGQLDLRWVDRARRGEE